MKKGIIFGIGILAVAFILIFSLNSRYGDGEEEIVEAPVVSDNSIVVEKNEGPVSWEKYNYDYVDENVKGILNGMLGPAGKTAFYLPRTGYINVSRGSKYGVAYALNNPNPSGENYFEFDWTVDDSVVGSCGVSEEVAQKWIERGWKSWGKIGEGWIDHMTIYFSFPGDIEPCSVRYNFVIQKDGVLYDSKSLDFNLI